MKSILASWMQALPSEPRSHGVGDIIERCPFEPKKPKNVSLRFLKKTFFQSNRGRACSPTDAALLTEKQYSAASLIEREKREKWFPVSETHQRASFHFRLKKMLFLFYSSSVRRRREGERRKRRRAVGE